MKNNLYILMVVLISASIALGSVKRRPSSIDLTSIEEIIFTSKKDLPYSDMGKSEEYVGSIMQLSETSEQLMSSDLYKFPKENSTRMTAKLCSQYVSKIFGPEKKRSLRLKSPVSLFDTSVGKACEFQLNDQYESSKIPFRYVLVGFIHGRLKALVWNLNSEPDTQSKIKLQLFWKTLK